MTGNESRYLNDRLRPKSNEWRNGPRISLEDLLSANPRAGIERMYPGELHGKPNSNSPRQNPKAYSGGNQKQMNNAPLRFTFGRHSGRLVVDVLEDNPGYIAWVLRENPMGFAAKLRQTGIDEGDVE